MSGICSGVKLFIWVTLLFAATFGVASAVAAPSAIEVERTGTVSGFRLDRTIATSGIRIAIAFDVEWRYRASTLLRDPIVGCALRVTNMRGQVSFQHDGKTATVAVTPDNADQVVVASLSFLMVYRSTLAGETMIRCGEGVVGRENKEPFNVTNGLFWNRTFCRAPRAGTGELPERLAEDWCMQGLLGEYLDADTARTLYADWSSHQLATPRIAATLIGVTSLVIDEQSRLRREAAEAARQDGGKDAASHGQENAAERPRSPLDMLSGKPAGRPEANRSDNDADVARDPRYVEAVRRAEGLRNRAMAECDASEPQLETEFSEQQLKELEAAQESGERACRTVIPAFENCCYRDSSGDWFALQGFCMYGMPQCTPEIRASNTRNREYVENQLPICIARAEQAHAEATERALVELRAESDRRILAWRQNELPACMALAEDTFTAAVSVARAEAERHLRRLRGLSGLGSSASSSDN